MRPVQHANHLAWASTRRTSIAAGALLACLAALTLTDRWLESHTGLPVGLPMSPNATKPDLLFGYGPADLAARARWLWAFPVLFAVLDVVENIGFGVALAAHPRTLDALVAVLSPITQVKLLSFPPTVAVLLASAGALSWRRVRQSGVMDVDKCGVSAVRHSPGR